MSEDFLPEGEKVKILRGLLFRLLLEVELSPYWQEMIDDVLQHTKESQ